ncbi:hypothetical protein PM082_020227 [Marasmius tenuissimus]|nr:hypothetical protein PM082_020227 [Marasmius tenuissimus]
MSTNIETSPSANTLHSEHSSDGVVITPPAAAGEQIPYDTLTINALQLHDIGTAANSQDGSVDSAPLLQEQPASLTTDNRDQVAGDNVPAKSVVQNVATNSWGNGNGRWGKKGWDDHDENAWGTGVASPKIVSLTSGRPWADTGDDAVFRWRTQGSSGKSSHRHITFHTRRDLHGSLNPLGDRRTSPLSSAASDKWARTLIIRSLPEARHAGIPAPDFTLSEVKERLAEADSNAAAIKKTLADNHARMEKIRVEQEPLRAALRALDNERSTLLRNNEEIEKTLQELADVQADLNDLESLALAFC